MAYTLIATQTLVAPSGTVTFSNIPGTFKDLLLEYVLTETAGTGGADLRVNGATSGYSTTALWGTGSAASSGRASSRSIMTGGNYFTSLSSTTPAVCQIHFMSYANTNVNKTVLVRYSLSSAEVNASVNLWQSTNAITSVSLATGSGSYGTGSKFVLWGVS